MGSDHEIHEIHETGGVKPASLKATEGSLLSPAQTPGAFERHEHALGSHGADEREFRLGAEGAEGVTDGEVQADAVHERRFPHGF